VVRGIIKDKGNISEKSDFFCQDRVTNERSSRQLLIRQLAYHSSDKSTGSKAAQPLQLMTTSCRLQTNNLSNNNNLSNDDNNNLDDDDDDDDDNNNLSNDNNLDDDDDDNDNNNKKST